MPSPSKRVLFFMVAFVIALLVVFKSISIAIYASSSLSGVSGMTEEEGEVQWRAGGREGEKKAEAARPPAPTDRRAMLYTSLRSAEREAGGERRPSFHLPLSSPQRRPNAMTRPSLAITSSAEDGGGRRRRVLKCPPLSLGVDAAM